MHVYTKGVFIYFNFSKKTYSFIFQSCVSGSSVGTNSDVVRDVSVHLMVSNQHLGGKNGIACHFDDSCIFFLLELCGFQLLYFCNVF